MQTSAVFAFTEAYNFQHTHILGASRGHHSDSVISLFSLFCDSLTFLPQIVTFFCDSVDRHLVVFTLDKCGDRGFCVAHQAYALC